MNERLQACCVPIDGTLRQGLEALERGTVQIAFAVDAEGRLVGTLTDGDARRALLKDGRLDQPIAPLVSRRFVSATEADGRAAILDLMQARRLGQIPVLAGDGRLVALHTLHELLGRIARPQWAVLMAGGIGQRLRPITEHLPKPMIPVAGRPILERLVLHLVGYGIERIFLAVRYKAEMIEEHFANGERFGCRIEYLREDRPLGTAGALSLLPDMPSAPLLVMNGDLVAQFSVAELLDFHQATAAAMTVMVHTYTHAVPFGVLDVKDSRVSAIHEKPTAAWQTSAGIYVLSPAVLAMVPPAEEVQMPSLVQSCLDRELTVAAFASDDDWIDVGRAPELRRAREGT